MMKKNLLSYGFHLGVLLTLSLSAVSLATPIDENADSQDGNNFTDTLRFGLACLYTNVGKVNYQIKWGENGTWQNMSVQTGWRSHYYQYPNSNDHKSPNLYIKFDSDMSGGQYWQEYKLVKYASEDTDCNTKGKKYRFEWDNSHKYIDLKAIN